MATRMGNQKPQTTPSILYMLYRAHKEGAQTGPGMSGRNALNASFVSSSQYQWRHVTPCIYGGEKSKNLEKNLSNWATGHAYTIIEDNWVTISNLRKRKQTRRLYLFMAIRQMSRDTTTSYAAKLKEKAKHCDFGGKTETTENYVDRATENIGHWQQNLHS